MIQPVVFTWANKVLARDGDDAARAVILYSMNGKNHPHALLYRKRSLTCLQAHRLFCLLSGVSSSTQPLTLPA